MSGSWYKVQMSPGTTIRSALENINNEALRIALVVDHDQRLLGVVTDGDIRRGLLNGYGLEGTVESIMNRHPVTAPVDADRGFLVNKMNQLDLLSIPIIDDGKLVGLETLHNALVKEPVKENPVFIMAGGFGTRLRPLTDNCPKPMLKVGDKPILETVIRSFIKAGFINFYISTHFMPEDIRNYFGDGHTLGINITYVHEDEPLGTGGALGLLPKDLPSGLPLIMINGDVLTKVDFSRLLDFHVEKNADATMCVCEHSYQIPYGVISSKGNKIVSMLEKPIQQFFINAGIYVVSPRVIQSVPHNHCIDMPTLLEQHIEERDNVFMFPIYEYWLDIGRLDDFERAQQDYFSLGMDNY
jgi:dTDP-glucose pyrophosphorylase